jgi:hypothetical protein
LEFLREENVAFSAADDDFFSGTVYIKGKKMLNTSIYKKIHANLKNQNRNILVKKEKKTRIGRDDVTLLRRPMFFAAAFLSKY